LAEQPDEQIDSWAAELMRDMSIRRGVLFVLAEFGGQPPGRSSSSVPSALGRAAPSLAGRGWPAHGPTSLRHLVPGLRRETTDARERLIDYLVGGFHEIVYI
jgi:hypothetical protein